MITYFLFPNILTQGNCLYHLGEAAHEKQTSLFSFGGSMIREIELLSKWGLMINQKLSSLTVF